MTARCALLWMAQGNGVIIFKTVHYIVSPIPNAKFRHFTKFFVHIFILVKCIHYQNSVLASVLHNFSLLTFFRWCLSNVLRSSRCFFKQSSAIFFYCFGFNLKKKNLVEKVNIYYQQLNIWQNNWRSRRTRLQRLIFLNTFSFRLLKMSPPKIMSAPSHWLSVCPKICLRDTQP